MRLMFFCFFFIFFKQMVFRLFLYVTFLVHCCEPIANDRMIELILVLLIYYSNPIQRQNNPMGSCIESYSTKELHWTKHKIFSWPFYLQFMEGELLILSSAISDRFPPIHAAACSPPRRLQAVPLLTQTHHSLPVYLIIPRPTGHAICTEESRD